MNWRELLAELPGEALVPVGWIRAHVDSNKPESRSPELSVKTFAELVGRSAAQVRSWCALGHVPGAYRLPGAKRRAAWRIPAASVEAFRERLAPVVRPELQVADLGEWRRIRKHA